jgi:hypothetical protein
MKDKGMLKLTDFSEFRTMTFSFNGIFFTIQVHENRCGQLQLVIATQGNQQKNCMTLKLHLQNLTIFHLRSLSEIKTSALEDLKSKFKKVHKNFDFESPDF